jgi:hydrogenase maturation protease
VKDRSILIYGYGNPGRQDDGLGNAFVEAMEEWAKGNKLEHLAFDSNYQLNIEDAAAIAEHDMVFFVDASTEEIDDFMLSPVDANTEVTFTTHAASPGYIVHLCGQLYDRVPDTFLLHIKGYEWAFREGLSAKGRINLSKAMDYLKSRLQNSEYMTEGF